MTFGMECWSLIGAQGKYKLATWVSFISMWGICMPLAALFVYVLRFNLQGLMAAATVGYTCCGTALSYLLLSTDWNKEARKIRERNAEEEDGTQLDSSLDESLASSGGENANDDEAEEDTPLMTHSSYTYC